MHAPYILDQGTVKHNMVPPIQLSNEPICERRAGICLEGGEHRDFPPLRG